MPPRPREAAIFGDEAPFPLFNHRETRISPPPARLPSPGETLLSPLTPPSLTRLPTPPQPPPQSAQIAFHVRERAQEKPLLLSEAPTHDLSMQNIEMVAGTRDSARTDPCREQTNISSDQTQSPPNSDMQSLAPIGLLLDQPEAEGPIYIAEVDESGTMVSNMLKHPSLQLQSGDLILEVDGVNLTKGFSTAHVKQRIRCNPRNPKFVTITVSRNSAQTLAERVTVVLPRPQENEELCSSRVERYKRVCKQRCEAEEAERARLAQAAENHRLAEKVENARSAIVRWAQMHIQQAIPSEQITAPMPSQPQSSFSLSSPREENFTRQALTSPTLDSTAAAKLPPARDLANITGDEYLTRRPYIEGAPSSHVGVIPTIVVSARLQDDTQTDSVSLSPLPMVMMKSDRDPMDTLLVERQIEVPEHMGSIANPEGLLGNRDYKLMTMRQDFEKMQHEMEETIATEGLDEEVVSSAKNERTADNHLAKQDPQVQERQSAQAGFRVESLEMQFQACLKEVEETKARLSQLEQDQQTHVQSISPILKNLSPSLVPGAYRVTDSSSSSAPAGRLLAFAPNGFSHGGSIETSSAASCPEGNSSSLVEALSPLLEADRLQQEAVARQEAWKKRMAQDSEAEGKEFHQRQRERALAKIRETAILLDVETEAMSRIQFKWKPQKHQVSVQRGKEREARRAEHSYPKAVHSVSFSALPENLTSNSNCEKKPSPCAGRSNDQSQLEQRHLLAPSDAPGSGDQRMKEDERSSGQRREGVPRRTYLLDSEPEHHETRTRPFASSNSSPVLHNPPFADLEAYC